MWYREQCDRLIEGSRLIMFIPGYERKNTPQSRQAILTALYRNTALLRPPYSGTPTAVLRVSSFLCCPEGGGGFPLCPVTESSCPPPAPRDRRYLTKQIKTRPQKKCFFVCSSITPRPREQQQQWQSVAGVAAGCRRKRTQ